MPNSFNSVNTHHIMGIVYLVILTMTLSILPYAHAIDRNDIDLIEEKIASDRQKLAEIEVRISEQKITIQNNEKTIDVKKDELRELRDIQYNSWEGVQKVEDKEKEIVNAENSWKESKKKLVELLNEKSKLILAIKLGGSDLIKSERELKTQERFDTGSIRKLVGIELSKSCVTMIMEKLPNDCPTYKTLQQLDTSIPEISGKWVVKDGMTQRDMPPVKNSWRFYDHDETPRIIVNPPAGMSERIPMITIQPNFNVYFLVEDMRVENSTRVWHEGRYIDNCETAVIGTDDWKRVLADTIYTLRNDCTITTLQEVFFEELPFTDLPIEETRYWKDKTWLENTKEKCKTICKEY